MCLMKKWQKILIEIIAVVIFILVALKLVQLWTGVNPLDNITHQKDALENINEVAAALTLEMEEGKDGTVVLFIEDIPESELLNINYIMSNLNGSVDSFQLHPKLFGIRRVDFQIVRSDNSYVYDAYMNGTPIPEDRVEAQKLYKVVKQIIEIEIGDQHLTEYQRELVLHDYLVEHCTYSYGKADDDNEFRAYGALVEGQAVCNGYAEAMALLLSCAGVENQYVVGTAKSGSRAAVTDNGDGTVTPNQEKKENHAWNLVKLNGTWYHLDATWDDPVGEKDVLSHAYFNMSDELMERDHTWNHDKYESCPDMSWNYFVRSKKYFQDSYSLDAAVTQMVTAHPYGTLEFAYSQFEITNTTLQGLSTVPGLSSVYYSTVGSFAFSVITLYINQ